MEWVKLDDIADIKSGGTPRRSKKEYWDNANIPWVKISDFNGKFLSETEEFISKKGLENSSAKLFKAGTILYSIFATIGEATILEIDASTNQAIAGIKINESLALKEYVYYYLLSIKNSVMSQSRGVAQNNINLSIIRNFDIPLPSKKIQQSIINSLSLVENLIQTRQDQVQALDDLVESILYNFIKNKNNKFEILGNIFEIKSGATPSRKNERYWNSNDIPWVKSNQINGDIINSAEEYISEEGYKNSSTYMFPKNAVLIAMYGQGKTRGQVGLLNIETTTNQAIAGLIPTDSVNMKFVFYQLKNMYENLRSYSQGGNQKNLSVTLLKQIKIILPPIEKQNHFAAFVEKIEGQKEILNKSLSDLRDLFDSLMQDAFDGSLMK